MKKPYMSPVLRAAIPCIITIAYLIIGYTVGSRGWATGWILFLLIPVIESLFHAIKTKNPSHFAYPVFVAAIFLICGMIFGVWHPTWTIFVTIPMFYAITDAIKKQKMMNQAQNQQQPGSVPNVTDARFEEQNKPKKSSSAVAITAIICGTVIAVVAIAFAFDGGKIQLHGLFEMNSKNDIVAVGDCEVNPDDVKRIDVNWVSGEIRVEYSDKDKIVLKETADKDISEQMGYRVENGILHIDEYANSDVLSLQRNISKNLTVTLPKSFTADRMTFDIVSADLVAEGVNTRDFEVETVSADCKVSFATQPRDIEIEAVSADCDFTFAEGFTGYRLSKESASGRLIADDFDNLTRYGDESTRIEFESVSGNLVLHQAK